jgi:hypothetical protein
LIFKNALFFVLTLAIILQFIFHLQTLLGISPSFTRQEIIDSPKDWNFWKENSNFSKIRIHNGDNISLKNADRLSQCMKYDNNFVTSDIDSVSYISDGKRLNTTVWLTAPFDPISKNDTIDTYQENLKIKIQNLTLGNKIDLGQLADIVLAKISNPLSNFTLLEKNTTTVSNNAAYKLVYTALNSDDFLLKNMTLLTIKNNKLYDITFSALNKSYDSFLPTVKQSINSLQFINFTTGSQNGIDSNNKNITNSSLNDYTDNIKKLKLGQNNTIKNQSEFKDIGIRITHPVGWSTEKIVDADKNKLLVFKSHFSDERFSEPSYHETTFTMAISIDSPQHAGITDYRIIYSKEKNNVSNNGNYGWHWTSKFMEVSTNDKERILEKTNSTDIFDKLHQNMPNYVLFTFDLDKINLPQQYRVLFYMTDYLVLSHIYCRLVDTTNWAMIPPPEFEISSKPNSLTLRPGESSNVEVALKGNIDLPTRAFFISNYANNNTGVLSEQDKKNNELQIKFIQNKISIPSFGTGTTVLNIKVPDNYNAGNGGSLTIPIAANISFPTTITNRGGESFSNLKNQSMSTVSNLTLTVLPPYDTGERLNNFVSTWITPISGMWSFLAGVAAVLTPVIIKLYNKKRKNEDKKDYESDN